MISWALHKLQKIFTRKKFPKWLSSEVEKEYKLLKGKKCFSILKNNDVAALAEPTRKCKFLLFFTAIFVLFLSYELPLKNYEFLTKSLTIDKSLLITTHAVICLIIFALLIFIVETAKNGFQIDKLRVLLYDSFIYPITVSAIYVFLVLLLSPASLIGIALIVLMGLFTIFSIGRTISLLLNSVKFTNAKQRMLKNRLLHCIEQETKERIGNNLLNAKFVGSNSISFSPFKPDTNSYAPIKLKQTGVITDINIAKLNKLLDESQNRDNENILAENNPQLSDSSKEQSNDSIKPPRLFLCPYCFDTNLTDGVVGWVDKEILVQIPDFHKRIARMIKIDESANSFSKNVKLEIGDLQKECINAINNKYINVIKECADLYVKLAITFSEYFYKINAGYSAQEAKQEVHSFVGGWKQIDWLQDHISALIEIAVSSNNINVVIEVIYIPFAIIKRTFKHYDHYIFQVFIRFAELIYQQKHSCCNKKIQDLLLDRTWRYLDEVNSFYLLPQLKEAYKAKDENKISSMKDFAIQFVWQATTLLRLAFEKNNSDDFVIFIDNIGSLYKTSYDSNKIIEELSELQQNLLFCLGAWMLYKYEASCSAEQKIMLEKIIASLPHDLEKITQLFLATHGEFTGRYAISAWYIILDGKAHSIPTSKWQQKFYWLLALKIISNMKSSDIDKVTLPVTQKLFDLVEKNVPDFMTQLDNMIANKSYCDNLLSEAAFENDKINALKNKFKETAKAQHAKNEQQIEEAVLDEDKRNHFIDSVLTGYGKRFSLRNLLAEEKAYHIKTENIPKFGYKRLLEKKGFIASDQNIDMNSYAENLGVQLLLSENIQIFKEVKEKCIHHLHLSKLAKHLNENFKTHKDILLLANSNFPLYKLTEQNSSFKMNWQLEQNSELAETFADYEADCYYQWKNKWLPVCQIYGENNSKKTQLLILNKKLLPCLTQAIFPKDPKIFDDGRFYIDLRAFSADEELLQKLLDAPPEWLKKYGDKQAQTKHLKQNVLFELYEHFSLSFSDKFSGKVIEITDTD